MAEDVRDFLTFAAAAGVDVVAEPGGRLAFNAPAGMPPEALDLAERLAVDPSLGPRVWCAIEQGGRDYMTM